MSSANPVICELHKWAKVLLKSEVLGCSLSKPPARTHQRFHDRLGYKPIVVSRQGFVLVSPRRPPRAFHVHCSGNTGHEVSQFLVIGKPVQPRPPCPPHLMPLQARTGSRLARERSRNKSLAPWTARSALRCASVRCDEVMVSCLASSQAPKRSDGRRGSKDQRKTLSGFAFMSTSDEHCAAATKQGMDRHEKAPAKVGAFVVHNDASTRRTAPPRSG